MANFVKGHFLITILATIAGLFVYFFLHLERSWEIVLVVGLAVLAMLVSRRKNLIERAQETCLQKPKFSISVFFVAAVVIIFALRSEHFALLMLTTVLLYITVCFGLTAQFGFVGLVNFAGIAFFGIGAYTTAVLYQYAAIPDFLIIVASGLVAAVIGSILILPILRTKGHYAALITIAFGVLFRTFLEVNDTLGGPQGLKVDGISVFGLSFNENINLGMLGTGSFYVTYAILALVLCLAAFVFIRRMENSWVGLNMDMVRHDEIAAASFGIHPPSWKILAFTLGNFFAGLAGSIYASMSGFIAPASFNFADSLVLVSIVLLGGLGNVFSVIPAAFLVVVLPEKLQLIQEYRLLIFGIVVILILRFKPSGIMPRGTRRYYPSLGVKK